MELSAQRKRKIGVFVCPQPLPCWHPTFSSSGVCGRRYILTFLPLFRWPHLIQPNRSPSIFEAHFNPASKRLERDRTDLLWRHVEWAFPLLRLVKQDHRFPPLPSVLENPLVGSKWAELGVC